MNFFLGNMEATQIGSTEQCQNVVSVFVNEAFEVTLNEVLPKYKL